MKKAVVFWGLILAPLFFPACKRSSDSPPAKSVNPYEIVIFQSVDSPTGEEVRKGIRRAFEESGLREGEDIRIYVRIASGGLSEVQKVAQELAASEIDMIMPLSTACLQASIIAGSQKPIIFGSIANPFIAGAGESPVDHKSFVTGVPSTGPIRQILQFIRDVFPEARRIGTIWTPSEINSKYYRDILLESAAEMGIEIVAVPIDHAHEIPSSALVLINENVDLILPISDNTINSAFGSVGRVAEESGVPLFGAVLQSVEFGACAAMGFDFNDIGYKAGEIAIRVMNGESPAKIPFQYMDEIKIYINLEAALKQGVRFSSDILASAAKILGGGADSVPPAGSPDR